MRLNDRELAPRAARRSTFGTRPGPPAPTEDVQKSALVTASRAVIRLGGTLGLSKTCREGVLHDCNSRGGPCPRAAEGGGYEGTGTAVHTSPYSKGDPNSQPAWRQLGHSTFQTV